MSLCGITVYVMPKKKYIQRECKHHGMTTYVLENRGWYRCKKCRVENVTKKRQRNKLELIQQFGGKCEICGYDKCAYALHFHHLEPERKEFGISHAGHSRKYDFLLEEAKKCQLLCANCHAEMEAKKLNLPVCCNGSEELL